MNNLPPHNLDFEIAILSSCLLYRDDLDQFATLLKTSDFYRSAHQIIFTVILELHQKNQPVDSVTVSEKLISDGNFAKVGGGLAVSKLLDAPTATDCKYYAKIVRGHAVQRRLIECGNAIMKTAFKKDLPPEEALNKAQSIVLGIEYNGNGLNTSAALKELIIDATDRYQALQTSNYGISGVPSGLIDLDAVTCGFQASDLIILAARPSMGKTALAVNLARNSADQGYAVGVFSLEMSKDQITNRFVAVESNVNLLKFQSGKFSKEDWLAITDAQRKLYDLPIHIDDTPSLSYGEMRRRARRMKRQCGVGIILVDYLQLMRGDTQNGRVEEVSSISRNLKATAKELNIPIIALSQLNRAVEMRDNKWPRLSDLRDSGAIEQDADLVLFLYRDEQYYKDSKRKGIADVIIAKQRNGPTGTIGLQWQKTTTKFSNLIRDE